jgi:catechol 2,3-dioxygenase-like lactoylglutathione lyase family enzyme
VTNEELRELNRSRKIAQIAFVTRDLERTMDTWIELLGVGPWKVLRFNQDTEKEFMVDGKPVTEPFEFRVGSSRVGDLLIELMEPVYGNLAYWRHLQTRGEGFHHFKEKVSDEEIPAALEDYRAKGIPVMQSGRFDVDTHYNLDSESKLGFVLELGNCAPMELADDMFSVYPSEDKG